MKNQRIHIAIAAGLIVMAAGARIVNHELHLYNLAPVGALALFCGAVIKDKRFAFLLAILAQFAGDLYIQLFTTWKGFYGIEQVCVYAALLLITLLGTSMRQPKPLKVLGYSIGSSVLFFIVSNFGVFLSIQFGKIDLYGYGKGMTGIWNTYVAAVPFFRNTLAGDIIGSIVLFGAYYLLQKAIITKTATAKA